IVKLPPPEFEKSPHGSCLYSDSHCPLASLFTWAYFGFPLPYRIQVLLSRPYL
ncbi:hypothetical protein BCR41DRAFT_345349, partial [Lobosporangium transversale]